MESGNSAKGGSSGKSVEAYGNKGYKVDKIYQSGQSGRICTKWLKIPRILQCWKNEFNYHQWHHFEIIIFLVKSVSPLPIYFNWLLYLGKPLDDRRYNISNDGIYKLPSCFLLLTEIFLVAAQTPLLHQTPTQFWVAEEAKYKRMVHHQTMYIVIRSKNCYN